MHPFQIKAFKNYVQVCHSLSFGQCCIEHPDTEVISHRHSLEGSYMEAHYPGMIPGATVNFTWGSNSGLLRAYLLPQSIRTEIYFCE